MIGATFFETEGALVFSNVSGSFYNFKTELNRGTTCESLVSQPDAWGGRAAVEWARRIGIDMTYDPVADRFGQVAHVLDDIYRIAADPRP